MVEANLFSWCSASISFNISVKHYKCHLGMLSFPIISYYLFSNHLSQLEDHHTSHLPAQCELKLSGISKKLNGAKSYKILVVASIKLKY